MGTRDLNRLLRLRAQAAAPAGAVVLLSGLLAAAAPGVLFAGQAGPAPAIVLAQAERPGATRPGEEPAPAADTDGIDRPGAVRPGEEETPAAEMPRPAAARPGEAPIEDIDRQLLPSLDGIVFVPSRDQIRDAGVPGVRGVDARTGDVLATPAFEPVASKYLGAPVTLRSLKELNRDVVEFYAANDFPVVDVVIPEQDITGGVVQMVVVKGRLGEVRTEGNRHFSSELLAGQVRLKSGSELRGEPVLSDVEWLNRNPFRQVDLVYARGSEQGETDVILRTQDRFPLRVYAGYEDSGNQFTGDHRLSAGFNWGNAWGLDHRVNYQFTADDDTRIFRAHSGTYIAPLPWRHVVSVFASHVRTQAEPGSLPGGVSSLDLLGKAWQISGRYTVPLPNFNNYSHELSAGYDFKSTNNQLEFGALVVRDSVAEINQFVATYSGSLLDGWGRTTLVANLHFSPGDMIGANDDAAFEEFREFASSDYTYGRIQLSRVQQLPLDFALLGTGTVQFSNKNLLGSEQLGAGGYATVRGYEERALNADEGYIVNLELRTPPVSILPRLGVDSGRLRDELQLLLFWDYAHLSNVDLLVDERSSTNIASVGPGLRYTIPPYLTLRFDYGWQLKDPKVGELDLGESSRAHVGLTVSY